MKDFLGYHSEWNLGSPGGWEYQRMCQELGKLSWKRMNEAVKIDVSVDFDHAMFKPVFGFSEMLLNAHWRNFGTADAFVVLVAEEETIGNVLENDNLVRYLNTLPGVTSEMAAPHELEEAGEKVTLNGREATVIFMDFNNDVLLGIEKKHDLTALRAAISRGILVNPRGMEPVGAKGVFEDMTTVLSKMLTETTVSRTPWTRRFYDRAASGPKGEEIGDLIGWTAENPDRVILKPEHGFSGKGIFVGPLIIKRGGGDKLWEESVNTALKKGGYIVQDFIDPDLWSEELPDLDVEKGELSLKIYQTDFRCFITDGGLVGFCARFGGIPTNVGSGGGVQAMALLKDGTDVVGAAREINNKVVSIGYDRVKEIAEEVGEAAVSMGLTYLLGPIKTALRPRILSEPQIKALSLYAKNLWDDSVLMEREWREGVLKDLIHLDDGARELSLAGYWGGSPALIASDGLFSFGAHIE